jgi:hypothetical protein
MFLFKVHTPILQNNSDPSRYLNLRSYDLVAEAMTTVPRVKCDKSFVLLHNDRQAICLNVKRQNASIGKFDENPFCGKQLNHETLITMKSVAAL